MKSILFINGHLNAGGCERSLVDVLKNIDYNKYKVDLLLLEELGDYEEEIPDEVNIQLYSLNNAFGSFLTCITRALKNKDMFSFLFRLFFLLSRKIDKKMLKFVRPLFKDLQKSYDVIVAYRPGICTELAAYVFKTEKKISWWHHGEMNFMGDSRRELHQSYYRMDKIVAVSKSSAELVAETFPDISNKICVIPNMICVGELEEKSKVKKINREKDTLTVVSVGRLSPEKNFLLCPKIGRTLKKRGIAFNWYIVGDGIEYDLLVELIEQYQLNENFILTGRLQNPYPYVAAADFLIHPSLIESQGITILESMTLMTPVIAIESKGPKEFIKNGINGYMVNTSANEVVDIIEDLWKKKEKYLQLKSNTKCPEQYLPVVVSQKIEELLEDNNNER